MSFKADEYVTQPRITHQRPQERRRTENAEGAYCRDSAVTSPIQYDEHEKLLSAATSPI